MPVDLSLPGPAEIQAYLRYSGWTEQPPGRSGVLWVKGDARIGLPFESDDVLLSGVVARIAKAAELSVDDVARAARYLQLDVTYLRVANDFRITDTIPLDSAARVISSGKAMLRATATTARGERGHIGSGYSRLGDAVVSEALMGHTEQGSFVIPVLVPLPDVELRRDSGDLFDDPGATELYRTQPEPFERRVVRTFAQSMQAVHELVVEPAVEPSTDALHELVYRGVSREFCAALGNILNERAVSLFETRFEFAPVVPPPQTIPSTIPIESEAADLVGQVAQKLRQQKVTAKQVFSGTIVQLRHERQDDPYGEIAISTIRRGRPAEIRIRLRMSHYRRAWEWHSAGRAVLVEGTVRRTPGKPGIVDNPIRCHPVDDLFAGEG